MPGSLGPSSVPVSKSPVFLAKFSFLLTILQCGQVLTPLSGQKKFIDIPVDRIPDVNLRLNV